MNQLITGLDVCKDSVVCCTLEELDHREPRQLYRDLEFKKLYANVAGIKELLALKADVAVLEPTGTNYSKIWCTKLAENGIKVILVGHKQLRSYRENLGLPDKDDFADSLALALYYRQHQNSPDRFVRERDPVIAKMRDCVLRLHHLNRCQSPVINRIRQDLAWQFPECAKIDVDAAPLFWGWLAGERKSDKYDRRLKESVGLGLQSEIKEAAKALVALHAREANLEREMRSHLCDSRFLPYRKVFAQFGFGERTEALLLSQIYPLENYLKDGKPEIIISRAKASLKNSHTKKHISLRKFQKALGCAPQREESGDSRKTKKAGSALCRTALWQWMFTRFEVRKCRPKSAIAKILLEFFLNEKDHKPIKLARARTAARASQLLFKALVEELK